MITFESSINISSVQRLMLQVSETVKKNMELAVRYSAMEVHQGARDLVPVVTGNLRDSINIKYLFEYPNYAAMISSNVEYAGPVEFNEWTDHSVGPRDRTVHGKVQHMQQSNAKATFGYFRKTQAEVEPRFLARVGNVLGGIK